MNNFKVSKWGMYMREDSLRVRDTVLNKGDIIALSEPNQSHLNPSTMIYDCKKVEEKNKNGDINLTGGFRLSNVMIIRMLDIKDYNGENNIKEIEKLF